MREEGRIAGGANVCVCRGRMKGDKPTEGQDQAGILTETNLLSDCNPVITRLTGFFFYREPPVT